MWGVEYVTQELLRWGRSLVSEDEGFNKRNVTGNWWSGGYLFWISLELAEYIEAESTGEAINVLMHIIAITFGLDLCIQNSSPAF